jgi:nucleoside-diphosphate-sugar epimerase
MKILVTGGAGFIGSHLVDKLVKDHEVVILDDFSAGNESFVPQDATVERVDILDWKKVESSFESFKPEAVFHLAALIDIRSEFSDSRHYATDSMNILQWSKKHGVKQFIYASSAAVYGDNTNFPLKESEPYAPTSAYGKSKMHFEEHLVSEHRKDHMKTVVLRYANVYGPRQGTVGEGGVIAVFSKQSMGGGPLTINGDGEQTRDFVYVDDIVDANIRALASTKKSAVYNVSTTHETSINELAEELLSISQKNVKVEHADAVKGEVLRSSLDNTKIKKELNWKPQTNIKTGLTRTWEWFSKNL